MVHVVQVGVAEGEGVPPTRPQAALYTLASKLDVALFSFVACYILGELVRVYWTPKHLDTEVIRWRWKNTAVSLAHSTLSGIAAIYWCYVLVLPMIPEMVIEQYSANAERLMSFTTGYFLYDMWDMMRNQPSRHTYELMAHHLPVAVAFCISLAISRFGGIGAAGLVIEASSVFLHIRQLLLLHGISKDAPSFRIISVINLGAFIPCRFGVLGSVVLFAMKNRHYFASPYYEIVIYATSIIALLNAGLFCRLYRSDVLRQQRPPRHDVTSLVEQKLCSVSTDQDIVKDE